MKSKLLNRIADRKFEKLGFVKVKESDLLVSYQRPVDVFGYVHVIELSHRKHIPNLMISYQQETNNDFFNNCVGVSSAIMRASLLKMFAMGFTDKNKKGCA